MYYFYVSVLKIHITWKLKAQLNGNCFGQLTLLTYYLFFVYIF